MKKFLSLFAVLIFTAGIAAVAQAASEDVQGDLYVLEAEAFVENRPTNTHAWQRVLTPGDFSGQGAMAALPDNDRRIKNPHGPASPSLGFAVNFHQPGRYYIWVRAHAVRHGNSLHAGLNGDSDADGRNITVPIGPAWVWANQTGSGQAACLTVDGAGEQMVHLWMREDGLTVDKLLLTTDADFVPQGMGPTEGGGEPEPPPTLHVLEAEGFDNTIDGPSHQWRFVDTPADFSAEGAMAAEPDSGERLPYNYENQSPSLEYHVDLEETGPYFVWVRGYADGQDNSLHIGLNGVGQTSGPGVTLPVRKGWVWSGYFGDSQRAVLQADQAGPQTLNIWMREDGLILDKIVLTRDPAFVPQGLGPDSTEPTENGEGEGDDFPAPSCPCYHGDGLYCGEGVSAQAESLNCSVDLLPAHIDDLLRCSNGSWTVEEECSEGCATAPAGTNDSCRVPINGDSPVSSCPCYHGDGLYCGEGVSAQAESLNCSVDLLPAHIDDLLRCSNGSWTVEKECSDGCVAADAGTNDFCRVPVSTDKYYLPWACNEAYECTQRRGHSDKSEYAFDFDIDRGTPILASRGGVVHDINDDIVPGNDCYNDFDEVNNKWPDAKSGCANEVNYVVVDHGDGTSALYLHLDKVTVTRGTPVETGDQLGESGNTGQSTGPHLHIMVMTTCDSWWCQSIPFDFEEGSSIDAHLMTPPSQNCD